LAAFGESISNLLSIPLYTHEELLFGLCYTQGITMQFFEVAEFMWITVIAYNLYLVIVKNNINVSDTEKIYHGVVWGVAFIATIAPVFMTNRGYGLAGVWCWIIRDLIIARFVLFYIPLYLMIIFVIVLYVMIISRIYKHIENMKQDEKETRKAKEFQRKIIVYPIIFLVLYIFPTINRIYDWLNEDDSFVLYLLHAASSPLLGFVNSICYGFDEELRKNWKEWLVLHGICVNLFKEDNIEEMRESISAENSLEEINISDDDEKKGDSKSI